MLVKLHAVTLPKIREMKTFLVVIRGFLVKVRDLRLQSLELESTAQVVNYLVFLHLAETPTNPLLTMPHV